MLRDLRIPFVLFVLLWVFAGIYHHSQPEIIIYDAIEYDYCGKNLVDPGVVYSGNLDVPMDFRLFSKRTVGYPLFRVFQWNTPLLIVLAQGGLLVFLYLLGLRLVNEFDSRRRVKQVYSWFMVLSPILLIHSHFGMADLLLATLITLMAYVGIAKGISSKNKPLIISALYLFGVLVKPVVLPAVPLVLGYALIAGRKNYMVLGSWLVIGLVVWGMAYVNYTNTGVHEYSNISKINLATYNAKLTVAHVYGYDSAQAYASGVVQQVPRNSQEYIVLHDRMQEAGKSVILNNLWAYAKLHTAGAIKMALDPGRFDLYTFFREFTADVSLTEMLFSKDTESVKQALGSKVWLLYLFGFLLIISVFKVVFALASLRRYSANLGILFLFIGYFLAITGPVGAGRFLLPVWVIGLVLSSLGFQQLVDRFQERSKS